MYSNLENEMQKQNITKEKLAKNLKITVPTLDKKLNGISEFNTVEMGIIQDTLINFPQYPGAKPTKLKLEYLFKEALENA